MKTNEQIPKDDISLKELIEKFRDWFAYLLSQWKIIVLAGFIGAALGLTYSFIKKPIYTATLSFALEDEKSGGGLGGALGLASSFGFDLGSSGGSIFTGSNLTELFKSRKMVEQTLLTPVVFNDKTNCEPIFIRVESTEVCTFFCCSTSRQGWSNIKLRISRLRSLLGMRSLR